MYFIARVYFLASVGCNDYILLSSIVRDGVVAFHSIHSKDKSGFTVYIGTTSHYYSESFVVDWVALK